jgi:hypothetical protein
MPTPWVIVIFAARESLSILSQTVRAALIAARDLAHIDVLVNGNPRLADDLAAWLSVQPEASLHTTVRVWSIAQAGKANAWSKYLHKVWSDESVAFFVDGYARLNPDAIKLLGDAMQSHPDVLGGTGVPSVGRTAKFLREEMLKHGGYHGNFCCIKGDVIQQIRERHILLPFGLYRVDSIVGALLSFGLRPELGDWNHRRIFVHPEASWQTDPKHWWRWSDAWAHVKRTLRQSRGLMENAAVKDHFVNRKMLPEQLPTTAAELVVDWAARCPDQLQKVAKGSLLAKRALREIGSSLGETADTQAPVLIGTYGAPR